MRDAQHRCSSAGGELSRAGEILSANGLPRPSEGLSLRRAPREPRPYPFHDPRSFEFGDRPEDVHLELAGRRRGVDAFRQTDEGYAERLQLLEECDQVLQIPAEPIESPAHQHIKPSALGVSNELVERWPPILRPADPVIDILLSRPAASPHVPPELL
jgi:hypothetical protein